MGGVGAVGNKVGVGTHKNTAGGVVCLLTTHPLFDQMVNQAGVVLDGSGMVWYEQMFLFDGPFCDCCEDLALDIIRVVDRPRTND